MLKLSTPRRPHPSHSRSYGPALHTSGEGGRFPKPPPPGVSISIVSPAWTSTEKQPGSSVRSVGADQTLGAGAAPRRRPPGPAARARGGWRAGRPPSGPGSGSGARRRRRRACAPSPPEPRRTANASTRTGKRRSRISGSVRRELVMWVWTALAPGARWPSRPRRRRWSRSTAASSSPKVKLFIVPWLLAITPSAAIEGVDHVLAGLDIAGDHGGGRPRAQHRAVAAR